MVGAITALSAVVSVENRDAFVAELQRLISR